MEDRAVARILPAELTAALVVHKLLRDTTSVHHRDAEIAELRRELFSEPSLPASSFFCFFFTTTERKKDRQWAEFAKKLSANLCDLCASVMNRVSVLKGKRY